MIEHSERRPTPTLRAQPRPRVTAQDGEKKLRVTLSVLGAQLTLLAAPARDPDRVVVVVRPLQAAPEHCDVASMWIDGERLDPEGLREVRNQRGHEIQFAIQRRGLANVADALRVALHVCGHEVELDAESKTTLGLFEVQFREQLSLLAPPNVTANATE